MLALVHEWINELTNVISDIVVNLMFHKQGSWQVLRQSARLDFIHTNHCKEAVLQSTAISHFYCYAKFLELFFFPKGQNAELQ